MSDINPMKILRDNDVEALYPDFYAEVGYEFDEKGMYFVKKGKRIDVVSKEYLDMFMPGYEEWLDGKEGVRIVQVYSSRDYYYYLVQYGVGGDIDFFQA
ncbi:MAG: hypothetical protein GTO09_10280, partial [Candidatus Latescibacteria bacterium]|nr:hypothetical protein [Candidatus Latescibacterota bacterium]